MSRQRDVGWIARNRNRALHLADHASGVVIVVGLGATAASTVSGLNQPTALAIAVIGRTVDALFAIEYVARIVFAHDRRKYVTSPLGIIDLVAAVSGLAGSVARDLRSLRLLRILSVLKFVRTESLARFFSALRSKRDEWVIFASTTLIVMYLAATGIYIFESEVQPEHFGSVPACLWWAVTTLTTVGYGDSYPVTPQGRFFTSLILLVGLGVVAVPAGIISVALTETVEPHK